MNGKTHHPDVRRLAEEATILEDVHLRSLLDVIKAELARRETIKDGLDVGERLRFDETIDLIRERTKLSEADALAMIRAHVPGRVRGMP
jgi:hypothetical protein